MNDSKRITEKKRCILAKEIQRHCIWGLGEVTHKEIDEINILQATYKAMCIAAQNMLDKLEKTEISIEMALIDGNKIPPQLNFSQAEAIVKGDSKSLCIAAASILAKVTRDTYMQKLALEYPQYGWETNAGYGSKKHREAIEEFGPSPYHRMSFAPLKEYA
jgi:ribonuclease HII